MPTRRSPRARALLTCVRDRTRQPLQGEHARGRAPAASGRDRREGDLERRDARRAASRRPRIRPGRPRAVGVRVARPAADRDPGLQARPAGPARRGRRATAAAAPGRCVLRAGPRAPRAPGAPYRWPAAGVRDHDDARGPGPGPRGRGDRVAGRARPPGAASDDPRPMRRLSDLLPDVAHTPGHRRGAPRRVAGQGVGAARRGAGAARGRELPRCWRSGRPPSWSAPPTPPRPRSFGSRRACCWRRSRGCPVANVWIRLKVVVRPT